MSGLGSLLCVLELYDTVLLFKNLYRCYHGLYDTALLAPIQSWLRHKLASLLTFSTSPSHLASKCELVPMCDQQWLCPNTPLYPSSRAGTVTIGQRCQTHFNHITLLSLVEHNISNRPSVETHSNRIWFLVHNFTFILFYSMSSLDFVLPWIINFIHIFIFFFSSFC